MKDSPSVVIVRLDAIGDALALTPLLAALRAAGARVSAVLMPRNAGAFSRTALERVHVAQFRLRENSHAAENQIEALGAELAAHRYDAALVATEDLAGYRLARASAAPLRVGFDNGWGKPFKTLWIRRQCTRTIYRSAGLDARGLHECEVLFELGREIFGPTVISRDVNVLRPLVVDAPSRPDERVLVQITSKWERLGITSAQLNRLMNELRAHHALRLVCAEDERAYAQRGEITHDEAIEYFSDLAAWKESIASARAVVAPDSGAVHVAGMTGTPVVALFAPANFAPQCARWAPWAAPYEAIAMKDDWIVTAAASLKSLVQRTTANAAV